MKNNQNEHILYHDQRLSNLDPDRLSQLLSYAKELSEAPPDQKMNTFLSINQRAAGQKIAFSRDERDLLIHVLTEQLSPEERKRVEIIRNLTSKLSSANSK